MATDNYNKIGTEFEKKMDAKRLADVIDALKRFVKYKTKIGNDFSQKLLTVENEIKELKNSSGYKAGNFEVEKEVLLLEVKKINLDTEVYRASMEVDEISEVLGDLEKITSLTNKP